MESSLGRGAEEKRHILTGLESSEKRDVCLSVCLSDLPIHFSRCKKQLCVARSLARSPALPSRSLPQLFAQSQNDDDVCVGGARNLD